MKWTTTRATDQPPVGKRRGAGPVVAIAVAGGGLVLLLAVAHLATARRQLLAGRSDLRAARTAIGHRDDAAAGLFLDRAARRLTSARAASSAFPLGSLRVIPLVASAPRAASSAARAGLDVVAAGRAILAGTSSFPTSAAVGVDGRDLAPFHDAAARSLHAVQVAQSRLAAAAAALAGPSRAFLSPVSAPARAMRREVAQVRADLAGGARGLALVEQLTAPTADVRLLLLSQDSLELRPTGGYIGSYGVVEISHSTVKLVTYQASEDLPPADPPLAPPAGLAPYLPGAWGLSNVNWWPDFPTTAAAAAEMFRRQGGGSVDGVLALTEAATARLIDAVGPLQLPDYPTPVVAQGFDQRVVQEVELKRPLDTPRKRFLIELSDVLFDRLFHLPAGQVPAVADAVARAAGTGDIQLWFSDAARERSLSGTAVAGALPHTDGDFLMVVDANLGASKANLDVSKRVTYTVTSDGRANRVAHLRIEIQDIGATSSINPMYNSYLRVYAPAGSRLVTAGLAQVQQPAADGPYTVFIQAVTVAPLGSTVVTFDYRLPERISHGPYRLTWVRQVGTPRDELDATLEGRATTLEPTVRVQSVAGTR